MTNLQLPDEVVDEIQRRHVEFLLSRLTSPAARADCERLLRQWWARLLDVRVHDAVDTVDVERVAADLSRALSDESVHGLLAPVSRSVGRSVLAALRDDEAALGDHVPEEARRAIEALAAKPDLIPERLLREVLRQEAVELALRDVLYDALKRFHDTVNPFFADWGIPALLSWLPIGAGAVRSSMEKMRAEFDKRLEPEIRKFLGVFSREATSRLADDLLARSNDPNLVALRRNVVVFLYDQPVRELLAGLDDETAGGLEDAVESVVRHALEPERLQLALRNGIDRFVDELGDRTVGQWLQEIGARSDLEPGVWIDLAWPLVERAAASPATRELVEEISREFAAGLR